MKNKPIVFGFTTKDLTTLNDDLSRNNNGILPEPWQICNLLITNKENYLVVHVQLIELPL